MVNHDINGFNFLPCSDRMITTSCNSIKKVITIHKLLMLIYLFPVIPMILKDHMFSIHLYVLPYLLQVAFTTLTAPSSYHSTSRRVLMRSEAGGQGSAMATSTALTYPYLAFSQAKYLSIFYLKFLVEICFL